MEKHCWKPGSCSEFLVIWDKTKQKASFKNHCYIVHFSTVEEMPMMDG